MVGVGAGGHWRWEAAGGAERSQPWGRVGAGNSAPPPIHQLCRHCLVYLAQLSLVKTKVHVFSHSVASLLAASAWTFDQEGLKGSTTYTSLMTPLWFYAGSQLPWCLVPRVGHLGAWGARATSALPVFVAICLRVMKLLSRGDLLVWGVWAFEGAKSFWVPGLVSLQLVLVKY